MDLNVNMRTNSSGGINFNIQFLKAIINYDYICTFDVNYCDNNIWWYNYHGNIVKMFTAVKMIYNHSQNYLFSFDLESKVHETSDVQSSINFLHFRLLFYIYLY